MTGTGLAITGAWIVILGILLWAENRYDPWWR